MEILTDISHLRIYSFLKLNMKKVILFILRINIFIFSYFLYLINVLFICLNLKTISKYFFIYASYFCSISLGLSYKFNKELKSKFKEKGIHIANHDYPFDIFVAQFIFRMPTITTVDKHLKKILPFFEGSLRNFGHFNFDHLNQRERKSAYLFLKNICSQQKSVLIYPSGSIYTGIEKRFSKSISKLSMTNNLKVIAWRIHYKDIDGANFSYQKDVMKFVLNRFLSNKIEVSVKKVKIFSPNNFLTEKKFHENIRSFYID